MYYRFAVKMNCTGYGSVEAGSIEEAKQKILNEEYDDIYDMTDYEILNIIEIEED